MSFNFAQLFDAVTGHPPFPWQQSLYDRFVSGPSDDLSFGCDIPTGLGKTSVIAIWYLALAVRPDRMPKRLVYVVNRRTVVDQTTTEVKRIRDAVIKLRVDVSDSPFKSVPAISTLRGQFADNREWSADPTRPAVICGTVDMIGSRLLFSGYGIGYKQRPLHAGFLGQDVLVVHDEAHLEQPFQELLNSIREEQKRCQELGRFHVMELTATSRSGGDVFRLTERESTPPKVLPSSPSEPIHYVWQRLKARKDLAFHSVKRESLVQEIARLALARRDSASAVLIFVRTVDDVAQLHGLLTNKKNGGIDEHRVAILTGTMRGKEREELVAGPVFKPFLESIAPSESVYLICTSAGEVGIDISAHHLVCDLSPLDSMIQRLGRVNRRGEAESQIDVVYELDPDPKKDSPLESARWKTLEVLQRLPRSENDPTRFDSSPQALRGLALSPEERQAAFSPTPVILKATDILFDAWSMTTIRDRLPGRPPVEPYLHGVAEWQPPETTVAWRSDVELLTREVLALNEIDAGDAEEVGEVGELFAEYPLKPHEVLKDRSDRVFKELVVIAGRHPDASVWLMDDEGSIEVLTLGDLANKDRKNRIDGKTVLLSPTVGGLTLQGTLSGKVEHIPSHRYDIADDWLIEVNDRATGLSAKVSRRFRDPSDDQVPKAVPRMRLIRELILRDEEEVPDTNELDTPVGNRFWRWYVRPDSADDDGSKTAREPILLNDHVAQVVGGVKRIVGDLSLASDVKAALIRAAEFHDLGKSRYLWQRSIGNPNPEELHAKSGKDPRTGKHWKPLELSTYRHELGSLVDILDQGSVRLKGLNEDTCDLLLHVVAAHHGRARPNFPKEEAFDPEPKGQDCEVIAFESVLRFARLQKRYGRWGLAYLESLLRAADYEASARPTTLAEDAE